MSYIAECATLFGAIETGEALFACSPPCMLRLYIARMDVANRLCKKLERFLRPCSSRWTMELTWTDPAAHACSGLDLLNQFCIYI